MIVFCPFLISTNQGVLFSRFHQDPFRLWGAVFENNGNGMQNVSWSAISVPCERPVSSLDGLPRKSSTATCLCASGFSLNLSTKISQQSATAKRASSSNSEALNKGVVSVVSHEKLSYKLNLARSTFPRSAFAPSTVHGPMKVKDNL